MRIKINRPAVVCCAAVAATVVAVQHHNTGTASPSPVLPTAEPPTSITLAPEVAGNLNLCNDQLPVLVDPTTGHLFGDQNFDGWLADQDCESY